MHPLQVRGIRQRGLQAAQLLQQARCAQVLVDGAQTLRALRVARSHLMAQAVGMRDVGRRHRLSSRARRRSVQPRGSAALLDQRQNRIDQRGRHAGEAAELLDGGHQRIDFQ